MANGIHFMAVESTKERLVTVEKEYAQASQQLNEAVKLGDLSENAEYDAAKEAVNRLAREREELAPVITMPVIRSSDNIGILEEGSVIRLVVHSVTPAPVKPDSKEFEDLKNSGVSAFEGVLMYGGTLSMHELLTDKAFSATTAVGKFIHGKQPGDYSIAVPGGFANVTVEKLHSSTPHEDLFCKL